MNCQQYIRYNKCFKLKLPLIARVYSFRSESHTMFGRMIGNELERGDEQEFDVVSNAEQLEKIRNNHK